MNTMTSETSRTPLKLKLLKRQFSFFSNPRRNRANPSAGVMSFSSFQAVFDRNTELGLPVTVLVLKVVNYEFLRGYLKSGEKLTDVVGQQLAQVFTPRAAITPLGDGEFGIQLPACEQCQDLSPLLDNALGRMEAGQWSGEGLSLSCKIGIARAPLDDHRLRNLLTLGSLAVDDLDTRVSQYQYVGGHHQRLSRHPDRR